MPNFIGPDGKLYDLEPQSQEALAELTSGGFRLESESPQTLGEQIKSAVAEPLEAAAEGFGKGATLGLTDVGAELGPQFPGQPFRATEERRELNKFAREEKVRRAEENPIAHLGGEFAGMLVNPVGEVGKGVEAAIGAKTVLSKIASSGIRGGFEGSLFGAGNAVSEAALGDTELTAEKLLAGAGLGGMLGAAGGGLGTSLIEGGKAAIPKALKAMGRLDLGDWAANKALKAAGAIKGDLKYLGDERGREVGHMLLERGHLGKGVEAPNARGVLESVVKDFEEQGATLGRIREAVDAAGSKPDFSAITTRLDDFEKGLSPLQQESIASDVAAARRAVAKYADKGGGFRDFGEFKQDLQAKAKWSNADLSTQGLTGDLKRKLSGVVREEFDSQLIPRLGSDVGKEYTVANELFGKLADAKRVAEHGVEALGGNAPLGLRDLGVGGAALISGGPVMGLVSAVAAKTMRERGNGVIARLAKQLSDSQAMSAIATSFSQKAQAMGPQLGQYASRIGEAAAISPQHALATHMVLAQADPQYELHANMAGFLPEDATEEHSAIMRGHGIAQLAAGVAAQDDDLEKHIASIFKGDKPAPAVAGGKDFGAKRLRKSNKDAHDERVEEIMKVASDPAALLERVAGNMGNMGNVAPGVAAALTQKAYAAAKYLAGEVKAPPKAGPLAPAWKPTETEKQAFARKYHAVVDPMSVLKHAAAGTLTSDELKALQAVYPRLARLASDQLLSKMSGHGKPVPYRAKLMLSMLSGISADGSTNGVAIARNQAAINAPSKKQDAQGLGDGGKSSGDLKVANRMATPGQRRQMQEE
jgi:hypothetical protein